MAGANGVIDANMKSAATEPSSWSPRNTSTTSAAGVKRKRDTKFYAVRIGKQKGIYYDWSDCLEQVRGYHKAEFKSFTSLTEAELYLRDGIAAVGTATGGEDKFYAVQKGRRPGVYTSWPQALEQITGWKGPKHKMFRTRAEAEVFVTAGSAGGSHENTENINHGAAPPKKAKAGRPKKVKDEDSLLEAQLETGGEYEPGDGPLPEGAEDDFDYTIVLDQGLGRARYKTAAELGKTTLQASRPTADAPVRIYTDGSSLSNGKHDAIGGVGVYFGPLDRRNVSEPLSGSRQTNQRAELTAILRALEVAPRDRKIEIVSDSNYAILCVTEWFVKWRTNNWLNASHKPVENKDLIQKVIDMLEERLRLNAHRMRAAETNAKEAQPWDSGPASVRFTWVKGHAKDEGNTAADELAVNGARVARELGGEVVLD